jgi:probable O-glycosylation ligase (exosortase A-associated)
MSFYAGLALLSVATIIGTHQRAALLALGVVAVGTWLKGRRKVILAVLLVFVGAGIVVAAPAAWWERMATISDVSKDGSIMVRLRVWEWTLNMVSGRPTGGGFEAYRKDRIVLPDANGKERVEVGRAFHSSFFEVLGEHGWFGLALFLSLLGLSFKTLRRVARQTRDIAHLKWAHDLAAALQVSLLSMLTCGTFISIAFMPFFYYVFALTQCLSEYVRRAELVSVAKAPAGNEAFALARP